MALEDASAAGVNPPGRPFGPSSAAGDVTLDLVAEVRQVGGPATVLPWRRLRQTSMAIPRPRITTPRRCAIEIDTVAGQGVRLGPPSLSVTALARLVI